MSLNKGINTSAIVGTTIGMATANSLRRASSHGESIGKQLYSALNMEFDYNNKKREEEKNEKEKNKRELSLRLEEEVFNNGEISEEAKVKVLILEQYLNLMDFYVPDVNNYTKTYDTLCDEYESEYYSFQGLYRRVAWSKDILSKDDLEKLNAKIETLNEEIKSLGVNLNNIVYMRVKIERGHFNEIDFSKYAKHIKLEVIELLCPESDVYLKHILEDLGTDIRRCMNKAERCLREAKSVLKENQNNIEKTLKYKVLNVFKRNKK